MKTILIIEDDDKIQDMLKIYLRRNGFDTVSAFSYVLVKGDEDNQIPIKDYLKMAEG